MKKKVIDKEEIFCLCGCSNLVHTTMNRKAWDELNKQIGSYEEDSLENREKFWIKFLTENVIKDELGCRKCNCEVFKRDNLKYLEQQYKIRMNK